MKWLWLVAGVLCAQQSRDVKWEAAPAANLLRDKGTRWALVVGISQHANLGSGAQLQFAHRDAEEFAGFLLSAGGGALPPSQVKLLTNEKATLGAIRAELHGWLPKVAGPGDVVYVFFAGHGVVAERGEAYFVAHDSDPQNLHATGLGFREVEETLGRRLRAGQVVLLADSCHAGQLGTAGFAPAGEELEKFGDRSVLKLLASRPSERSFEDARFNAGVFTHMLLEGLRGGADADGDRVVRVGEAIEYVTKRVAAETGERQNPRVAGQFDGRLALAVVPEQPTGGSLALEVRGPMGAGVWVDHLYRGRLGVGGRIRVDGLAAGGGAGDGGAGVRGGLCGVDGGGSETGFIDEGGRKFGGAAAVAAVGCERGDAAIVLFGAVADCGRGFSGSGAQFAGVARAGSAVCLRAERAGGGFGSAGAGGRGTGAVCVGG